MQTEGRQKSPIALADLRALADSYHESYNAAKPWPHLIIDGLVSADFVAQAETEELTGALHLEIQKDQTIAKAESTEVGGQAAKEILDSLLAPEFIDFLERITGIAGLIGDPSHAKAGLHVNPPGAFQALHRDFRRHPTTGTYHRINVLLFLNSDWKEEYGGELELWPADRSACGQRIRPEAGRVVIFETTPTSYHAIPDTVRCPPGRARLSLASYYYTEQPGPQDKRDLKLFLPKRPQDPLRLDVQKFKDVAKGVRARLGSR
jgi:hypothetical protein